MADEFIKLDTTIIGIDSLINKASTAEEAKVLFTVKDVIYNQQRFADVQDVKHGRWIDIYEWAKMHDSTPSGMGLYYWCSECQIEQEKKSNFCPNCGAKMLEKPNLQLLKDAVELIKKAKEIKVDGVRTDGDANE